MSKLSNPFTKICAMILSVLSMLALKGPVTFSPLDAENIKLNFSAIADTHIDNIFNGTRVPLLSQGLKDISNAKIKSDAVIIDGDMTEGGAQIEYYKLGFALNVTCKTDNLLPVSGNHDIWGLRAFNKTLMDYDYNADKYLRFLKNTAGIVSDNIYFYRIIKDCYFIVLNSEALEDDTYLSPAQIQWLDNLLAEAVPAGNPVFVMCHHPLASIGDEADALYDVMKKYDGILDVFFITGHWHTPFGENNITNDGTLYFVAMPSYGKGNSGGYGKTGTGFQAELYEDEIVFRARDFTGGIWVPEYDTTINLISG